MTKYNFGFRYKDDPKRWRKEWAALSSSKRSAAEATRRYKKARKNAPEFLEKEKAHQKNWRKKNAAYLKKYKVVNAKRDADRQREYLLQRKYGISLADFEKMMVTQNGLCWICKSPPGGRWTRLFVDHNHLTGKVRGLLCHLCNTALNRVENYRIEIDAYLEAHK